MRKRKANKLTVRENLKKKWIARKRNRAKNGYTCSPKNGGKERRKQTRKRVSKRETG